jgi:dipeptidyl aminopeptidase/acylaminoacyl peptidase
MSADSASARIFSPICTVLLAMTCVSWAAPRSKHRVQAVNTIPLQQTLERSSDPIEISKQGTLLVFPWGPTHPRREDSEPRLLLWDYQRQQAALEFPMKDDWVNWINKAPEAFQGDYWQFRFQGDGSRIVGMQTPWLVLIDVKKQAEIGRVLPSESYLRKDSPGRPSGSPGVLICHLAIDPQNGSVAAVYNIGKDTHLYVYDSDLKRQIASWQLPRMVKDLCWSPDGKKLAVLFNGRFGEDRKERLVDNHFWDTLPEPDVWIMDPRSGEPLVKFRTGTAQDQIAFSKDGNLIYVINDYIYYSSSVHRGAIRAFSVVSGALAHTISAGPKGVHSGLCLSPDGSLIAADASTNPPRGLDLEVISGEKKSRVVLLDAKTGHLLFEHHEETYGEEWDPLGMAFSPDGRLLFVDFPRSNKNLYQRIEVYSIDDINGSKQ